MLQTYFLGANTPEGFRSEYGILQQDPRIRQLLILKGGSGCGKSTLMKTVAEAAERLRFAVERVPCSGDPDSLDALLIPEIGFALADGTAPHVLEPELCGCRANYLNLGRFYHDGKGAGLASALQAARAANRFCYGPAYGCLAGAAAAEQVVRTLACAAVGDGLTERALGQLCPQTLPEGDGRGSVRRCWLTAITPAGCLTLDCGCEQQWLLADRYRIGAPLLQALSDRWRRKGWDLVWAMDPMDPEAPAGLLIPEAGLCYLREDPLFRMGEGAMLRLSLDAAVEEKLEADSLDRARGLLRLRSRLVTEAVYWLSRAKRHHDTLEALYKPIVDFDGVTAEAERLVQSLLTETD